MHVDLKADLIVDQWAQSLHERMLAPAFHLRGLEHKYFLLIQP